MIPTRGDFLVDSSVWIDHFGSPNPQLQHLLREGRVRIHPMVRGEVACGCLPRRAEILEFLESLPPIDLVSDEHVNHAIESRHWWSRGIGWVDAHLLASAIVSGVRLWTFDKRLSALAQSAIPNHH